jgi:hypothetical protein
MVSLGISERGYEVAVRARDNGRPFDHPAIDERRLAERRAERFALVVPAHEAEGGLVAEVTGLLDTRLVL